MAAARGGWKLSPSLAAMFAEANRIAPRRSRVSDGTIGDTAHSARKSDHNPADDPYDGVSTWWVCAADITHDPAGGWDSYARARELAAKRDQRVRYIISNGEWWKPDGRGWRRYTGSNPHDHHMHVSIHNTEAARNNLMPWFGEHHPPPIPPGATPEQIKELADMFVVIEGIGFFAQVGQVTIPLPSMQSYAEAKDRSDGVPMLLIPDEAAQDAVEKLIKQTAKAITI